MNGRAAKTSCPAHSAYCEPPGRQLSHVCISRVHVHCEVSTVRLIRSTKWPAVATASNKRPTPYRGPPQRKLAMSARQSIAHAALGG